MLTVCIALLSLSFLHLLLSSHKSHKMPIFTATLGSVSGGIAFLSRIFTTHETTPPPPHHHSPHSTSLVTPPPSSSPSPSFGSPYFSRASSSSSSSSCKRHSFWTIPKVSVSSENAETQGLVEQSLSPDEVKYARRSADWKAARAYYEKRLIYEGRVEGFNGGGLLIRFYSLLGFLPFPQLSPFYSCKEPGKTIQEIARGLTGSIISVKVIQADEDTRKLIFSEKEANWSKYSHLIKVGDILEARVGSVEDYGAFLHLCFPDGGYHLTGLVHISEVSWDLVHDVRDILTEGDKVKVKVINIDRGKSRITLSIKQLEEDPLLETLEKVIPQDGSVNYDASKTSDDFSIEPLPGLEAIFQELLLEDGIKDVKITRQGFERRVVSQDLQLWLSNAPPAGDQFTLLARAGRQVQEIQLTTSLDQEGIKAALQRVLERVP